MTIVKRNALIAIGSGLAAGLIFAFALFWGDPANGAEPATTTPGLVIVPDGQIPPVTIIHPDTTVEPVPLSAVVVSSCNKAVALFIQLDSTHLLRADPRQSDMFTAVNGKMVQSQAGPIPWDDAFKLASSAVLSSHVVIPCNEGLGA